MKTMKKIVLALMVALVATTAIAQDFNYETATPKEIGRQFMMDTADYVYHCKEAGESSADVTKKITELAGATWDGLELVKPAHIVAMIDKSDIDDESKKYSKSIVGILAMSQKMGHPKQAALGVVSYIVEFAVNAHEKGLPLDGTYELIKHKTKGS